MSWRIEGRDASPDATCTRKLDDLSVCGEPMLLFITRSPILGYQQLVVIRCREHISQVCGVLEGECGVAW